MSYILKNILFQTGEVIAHHYRRNKVPEVTARKKISRERERDSFPSESVSL